MKEPTLVILAAGLGSRYGGLKQIDAVGSHGESIIDFSIYDAIQAGFKHVVMIIRPEHATLFDEHIGNKIRPFIDLRYAFQDVHDLPAPYVCPEERTKPWGTTHAMLCCRDLVDGPFMICNADDFYGPEAFKQMYRFLTEEVTDDTFCMIGYPLQKTLTENGTVTRGLCQVENGLLTGIIETKNISKADDYAYTLNEDGTVNKITDGIASMNFWFHNTRRLIAGYSGEGSLPSDDPHFGLYVKADNAVRRELNLNFIENSDHSLPAIKELLEEIYTINAKLFDVGLDLTEHYLAEAFAFAERCLEEDLSLLPAASD